jgi:uncharacterized membrane protein YozB (DUF420 family)
VIKDLIPYLPAVNASLNAISGTLLVLAWLLIKQRRIEAHRKVMLAAFAASTLFLISYVTYHANAGSKPYHGTGWMRTLYFSILIPHILLAAAVVPLAIVTLRRGLARNDAQHRRIARITLPIWLFVSVTGVIVYLMLYRL